MASNAPPNERWIEIPGVTSWVRVHLFIL